ncbi:MAG: hypothetical protein KAU35_08840, partial [candidate division Zixibacteria bacterium]|nr:hypothetical protein [candidate division Zixibacteria bacterium]
MKRSLIVKLLLAGMLTFTGGHLLAQGGPDRGRDLTEDLRAQLEWTDQVIDRAREAVHASRAPAAQLALKAALGLQASAWEAFRNQSFIAAQKRTMQARDYAKKAIAASRRTEQNENVVHNKLERVTEQLERARESLRSRAGVDYEAMYRAARDNLDRAWEFYRTSQYRAALTLANQVERAIQKVIRAEQRQGREMTNYNRRVETVGEQIDNAADLVGQCESESAARFLTQAREAYRQSQELGTADAYGAALRILQAASRAANQAVRICHGEDRLAERCDRYQGEADRMKE